MSRKSKFPGMEWRLLLRLASLGIVLLVVGWLFAVYLQLGGLILAAVERLRAHPAWVGYGYFGVGALVAVVSGVLVWRWLHPPRVVVASSGPEAVALTRAVVEERIARNLALEAPVGAARQELELMDQRRVRSTIFIAVAGEINAGKSSLIRALVPEAEVVVSPLGGSTQVVQEYRWQGPGGDPVTVSDLPGFNGALGELDPVARDEALRAHVVIYLCVGDLSRDQFRELRLLAELGKPLVVALNQSDRLRDSEMRVILARLRERVGELARGEGIPVVAVSAGGVREVIRLVDGVEVRQERPVEPRLAELIVEVEELLSNSREGLEELRERSVFQLALAKLDRDRRVHRKLRAERTVSSYAAKAVLGATAAVGPGMDVVVQGYLGYQLVGELCSLYETSLQEVQIRQLLLGISRRGSQALPILLALLGNLCKAFPGVGTVAGGALHAVAYGLIFDSLGRALVITLEQGEGVAAATVAERFEEQLSLELEPRLRGLLNLVFRDKSDEPKG